MNKLLLLSCASLALAGCVSAEEITKPGSSQFTTVESAAAASTLDLANDFYLSRGALAQVELEKRLAGLPKDIEAIRDLAPKIGMSIIAERALFGSPFEINDTVSAGGKHEQHIYCSNFMVFPNVRKMYSRTALAQNTALCGDFAYLYFENRFLTATQNVPKLPPVPR